MYTDDIYILCNSFNGFYVIYIIFIILQTITSTDKELHNFFYGVIKHGLYIDFLGGGGGGLRGNYIALWNVTIVHF